MPDLSELCGIAVDAAHGDEAVEAYAEESRTTEVNARKGEVEGLSFSETRGLGVRIVSGGKLGYAWAADPTEDEIRASVADARVNMGLAGEDPFNLLPAAHAAEPLPDLYRERQATMPTERKLRLALDLEKAATSTDPRVTKVDDCRVGDSVSRVAIASTTGVSAEYARTDTWCLAVTLAEEGDETQTGFSYRIGRELDELNWEEIAVEAVVRAARMLGAQKPPTAKLPVVLDPFAGSSFLGVLAGALSAESVLKGRSLFADKVGEQVGAKPFTLVDDGRLLAGPSAAPFDGEGVPSGRTELFSAGALRGFLHNTYTAARMGEGAVSTGNASRSGYRSTPGVGTSCFYVEPGTASPEDLLLRAEDGILIQEVSGVHSGANPISGEFSVGATGLRIREGAVEEGLREMTIASTMPAMLRSISAVGEDLRFFSGVGVPSILIGEMTVAGV